MWALAKVVVTLFIRDLEAEFRKCAAILGGLSVIGEAGVVAAKDCGEKSRKASVGDRSFMDYVQSIAVVESLFPYLGVHLDGCAHGDMPSSQVALRSWTSGSYRARSMVWVQV